MASQDWFEKDFYATLGVAQDADAATIKKRYRKLARELHPDQNQGNTDAERRFKDVGEAYAVLSDDKQRQEYDAIRAMSHGGARFAPGGGGGAEDLFSNLFGGQGGNVRFSTGGYGAGGGGGAQQADFEDILRMFGGAAGGGAPGGRNPFGSSGFGGQGFGFQPQAGQDTHASVTLDFRQAVQGDTVTLTADGESITTRIPAGVKDGQTIRLKGKGGHGASGAPRGDLLLTVAVTPHPVFAREGDNLVVQLPVTFAEAALGATVSVPTLTGDTVKVKIAPGTPSGRKLRVKGRGVTRKGSTGDLIAVVEVVVPQRLSDEVRAAVEVLARSDDGHDPRAELMAQAAR